MCFLLILLSLRFYTAAGYPKSKKSKQKKENHEQIGLDLIAEDRDQKNLKSHQVYLFFSFFFFFFFLLKQYIGQFYLLIICLFICWLLYPTQIKQRLEKCAVFSVVSFPSVERQSLYLQVEKKKKGLLFCYSSSSVVALIGARTVISLALLFYFLFFHPLVLVGV